ncbi:hypothetical protein C8R43DRAFT_1015642 [Mycena crocata]|nr:hypothetical protein C8R43DRAFT_1015642 [Mycena crocata]
MERTFAAAVSASSHASTSAVTAVARETPASPFAQLLRHSRFATYDPLIKKTYYSPKQFVQRGYWGLKRPITQRKKNSFITIKQWEARQHYVEWNNSEDEVRFIRRMEELDVRPGAAQDTKWVQMLGPARNLWLVDSEFSPHNWAAPVETKAGETAEETADADTEATKAEETAGETADADTEATKAEETAEETADAETEATKTEDVQEKVEMQPEVEDTIPISSLGGKGRHAYGKKMTTTRRAPTAVIPNAEAMSPAEFKRYLARLRSIRPAFKEYLAREAIRQEEEKKQAEADRERRMANGQQPIAEGSSPRSLETPLANRNLLQVAQITHGPYHRLFLAEHTETEYNTTSKIQPQPHRNAALMYSHPSKLETLFRTKSKPGIVLTEYAATGRFRNDDAHAPYTVASFAGIAATLTRKDNGDRAPLMNPTVERENWPNAVAEMRPVMNKPLMVFSVPRVVGQDPEGLEGTRLSLAVTVKPGFDDPQRKNPFVPGSRLYVAVDNMEADMSRGSNGLDMMNPARGSNATANGATPMSSLTNPPKYVAPAPFYAGTPSATFQTPQQLKNNAATLSTLKSLLGPNTAGGGDEVHDDEL